MVEGRLKSKCKARSGILPRHAELAVSLDAHHKATWKQVLHYGIHTGAHRVLFIIIRWCRCRRCRWRGREEGGEQRQKGTGGVSRPLLPLPPGLSQSYF